MAEERKKNSREFKITAVELSLARGQVKEVAEELGIDPQLLSTWKYQFRNDKDIAFPGNGKRNEHLKKRSLLSFEKNWRTPN